MERVHQQHGDNAARASGKPSRSRNDMGRILQEHKEHPADTKGTWRETNRHKKNIE